MAKLNVVNAAPQRGKTRIEHHISQENGLTYVTAEVGLGKPSPALRMPEAFAPD